jgi:hypothetical protein
MGETHDAHEANLLKEGTRVEVWNRFHHDWSRQFEVAERTDDGYQLRRLSDGQVLPEVFPPDGVRPA